MVTTAMKLKYTCSLEEKLWPTYIAYSKAETYFANKGLSSQSYGEGNGTPLQYSCLENPMDGGAW